MQYFLSVLSLASVAVAQTAISATPHESYSSSVGVLGCKINTNRVAYWPMAVDCNNICVQVTYAGRSVNLLRIDQSGGAYDMSYDAWNYLTTGQSATQDPTQGGGIAMTYTNVDPSNCADLILTEGSKLPLSGANSMNFVSSCLADSSSWVGNNMVLYNIVDPQCTLGYDEVCSLDLAVSNQASCPHTLGLQTPLTSCPVYNIQYGTGAIISAATGLVVTGVTMPASMPVTAQARASSETSADVNVAAATILYMMETSPIPKQKRWWDRRQR